MADRGNPYKVVVFGAGAVGKSSITLRFVTDTFTSEYLPTIEDCYRKSVALDGRTIYLEILDTAGQEEYSALRDQWVRDGKAFLLVYSVTSKESFDEIMGFRDRILMVKETDKSPPLVLVGNKTDLESKREVSTEAGVALAKQLGVPFIECSALKGTHCADVFNFAIRQILKEDDEIAGRNPKRDRPHGGPKKWWQSCCIL